MSSDASRTARVVKLYSNFADLAWDEPGGRDAVETARLRGRLTRGRGRSAALAVGDRVLAEIEADQPVVVEILPRRTELLRRDPRDPRRRQVVAANVDRLLACASAERPPLSADLVDRHLVAAAAAGLEGAVVLTKCDLASDERVDELARPWRQAGLPIFLIARGDADGLERLRAWLVGRASVLVGASGVGKSTLRNALLGPATEAAATAAISERSGHGTHRTSAATFEPLPPSGFLVDTPGVRDFGLAELEPADLLACFPELAGERCRFRNCHHRAEPGCVALAALEEGRIHPSRLESLRRLRTELDASDPR